MLDKQRSRFQLYELAEEVTTVWATMRLRFEDVLLGREPTAHGGDEWGWGNSQEGEGGGSVTGITAWNKALGEEGSHRPVRYTELVWVYEDPIMLRGCRGSPGAQCSGALERARGKRDTVYTACAV